MTTTEPAAAEEEVLTQRQITLVFVALIAGTSLSAIDGTAVNTALSTIIADFNGLKSYTWVGIAYVLTSTAFTPLFAKLSDIYGRRQMFQASIAIFLVGSIGCGVAQNMFQLVLGRGVQGVGGGGLLALAFAIIGDVVPPRERGRYIGVVATVYAVGSVFGPLVGGIATDWLNWRWIFFVNVPVGAVAFVIAGRSLRYRQQRLDHRLDYVGSILLFVSVTPLIISLLWASGRFGWGSVPTVGLILLSVLGTAAFVMWEARAPEPVLPLRLFRNDIVRNVTISLFFISGAFAAANVFLPLYLQAVTGVSPTVSGLLLAPMTVGISALALVSGKAIKQSGSYISWPRAGAISMVLGAAVLSFMRTGGVGVAIVMVAMVALGAGLGAASPAGTLIVQNAVAPHDAAVASSMLMFIRNLSMAIYLAVFGALFNARVLSSIRDPNLVKAPRKIRGLPPAERDPALQAIAHAMAAVFRLAIPFCVVAVVFAWLIRPLTLRGGRGTELTSPAVAEL